MEFTKDSGIIIKQLIPKLSKCSAYTLLNNDMRFNKSLDNLLLLLYKEINKAEGYIKRKFLKDTIRPILDKQIVYPEMYGGKYMPDYIKTYIDKTIKYQLLYSVDIEGRKLKIYFGIFSDKNIHDIDIFNKYIRFICSWLYICGSFSQHICSKTLNVFLYFTPFKKTIPKDRGIILGPSNVNTAYTMRCNENNEIVLYREEEWKKVFIHETFHSYGFDPAEHQINSIKGFVKELFPIASDFYIGEAYVETWARILNAAYDSYYSLTDKNNIDNFLLYIRFSLQIERLYSIQQMSKILNYMGMDYKDLLDTETERASKLRSLYREDSNVFAYYILTGIFMNNYYLFLLWCAKNNSNIFSFSPTEIVVKSFKTFIQVQRDDPSLSKTIDMLSPKNYHKKNKKDKYLLYTTRMSAVEIV